MHPILYPFCTNIHHYMCFSCRYGGHQLAWWPTHYLVHWSKTKQLDLAFSTLAFTKKERGGKEEKWWNAAARSAQSPCSIQDLWKPTSYNETDERVKNVWARLRIWGATDITSISSGKISRWACHPTRLCSLHKKPLCCKTEECRFGKSKKK